jgi:hypothetical protein
MLQKECAGYHASYDMKFGLRDSALRERTVVSRHNIYIHLDAKALLDELLNLGASGGISKFAHCPPHRFHLVDTACLWVRLLLRHCRLGIGLKRACRHSNLA